MDINGMISFLLPILISVFCLIFIWRMLKQFAGGGFARKKMKYNPENVGDRLRKYIFLAAKANPNKSRYLKMKRTPYNEGGRIGYICGIVTGGDVTRFVFKTGRFIGFRKVIYCPVSMHTSLHHKEVFLHAISLENNGGFYFPIPIDEDNYIPYTICFDAFQKDLKKLERMDVQQVELEQVVAAMVGTGEADEYITAPEELPVTEVGDDEYA